MLMASIAQHTEAATAAFLLWQGRLPQRDRAQLRRVRTVAEAECIGATHRLDAEIPPVFGDIDAEWRPAPILAALGGRIGTARATGRFWTECSAHRRGTTVPVLQDARFRQCLSSLDFGPDHLLDRLDVACRLLGLYSPYRTVDRLGLCRSVLHVALWQQCREDDPELAQVFGHCDPRMVWADAYYCGGRELSGRLDED